MRLLRALLVTTFVLGCFVTAMDKQGGSDVATEARQVSPLLLGSKIPAINLTSPEGKKVSLNEVVKEKSTFVIFYRGSW